MEAATAVRAVDVAAAAAATATAARAAAAAAAWAATVATVTTAAAEATAAESAAAARNRRSRGRTCSRVWHGHMDTDGYLHLGSIAGYAYKGYLSIAHTCVCANLRVRLYCTYAIRIADTHLPQNVKR
jgi:hypothetical protein